MELLAGQSNIGHVVIILNSKGEAAHQFRGICNSAPIVLTALIYSSRVETLRTGQHAPSGERVK
jgi:hypothetical protein